MVDVGVFASKKGPLLSSFDHVPRLQGKFPNTYYTRDMYRLRRCKTVAI